MESGHCNMAFTGGRSAGCRVCPCSNLADHARPAVAHLRRVLTFRLAAVVLWFAGASCPHRAFADDVHAIETFPVESDGDLILLPVGIGGQQYSFVFDTGCFGLVFDVKLKPQLGIAVQGGVSATPTGGVSVEAFHCPVVDLGRIRLRGDPLVWTFDLQSIREFTGHNVMGLIGVEALLPYIIELDFDAGELRFLDGVRAHAGTELSLSPTNGGQLAIPVHVPIGGSIPFVLDTAFVGSGALTDETFTKLRDAGELFRPYSAHTQYVGGARRTRIGALSAISVGRDTYEGLDFSSAGPDNILGTEILSRKNVTFDFPEKKVYLADRKRKREPRQRDKSGIAILRRGGDTLVTVVAEGSPAASAGIRKDDELLQVGDMDVANERLFVVRMRLTEEHTEEELLIRRGRDMLRVRIPFRDWRIYDREQSRKTPGGEKPPFQKKDPMPHRTMPDPKTRRVRKNGSERFDFP